MKSRLIIPLTVFVLTFVCGEAAQAMYHPGVGRFTTRDPNGMMVSAAFAPRDPVRQYADGVNLYQYVRSNPLSRNDPSGLTSIAAERELPPEYDPRVPGPLPDGGELEFRFEGTELDEFPPCGFISATRIAGCQTTVTWHEKHPFACSVYKIALAASGGICNYAEDLVDQMNKAGPGAGLPLNCPDGKTCCNKRLFNGTYSVSFTVSRYEISSNCAISVSGSAKITFSGEIGECH